MASSLGRHFHSYLYVCTLKPPIHVLSWKKIPVGGWYNLSVLCDHPYLVSLLFAILLSLHLVTFLMFFITCYEYS